MGVCVTWRPQAGTTCHTGWYITWSSRAQATRTPPGMSPRTSPGTFRGASRGASPWHVARRFPWRVHWHVPWRVPLARRTSLGTFRGASPWHVARRVPWHVPWRVPWYVTVRAPWRAPGTPPGTSPDASASASLATSHGVPLACPSGASLRRSINHRVRDTSWAEVLPELIWISNSFSSVSLSSFEELLSLSYAFRQLKLKIQISSVRILTPRTA